ncbi:MAG: hypothetical protein GX792_09950 [Bacteroidales bacterium]|nr:hypothetical protein [Bacteroidales bacterium]
MKTNRRDFIKSAALASTGIATGAMASCDGNQDNNSKSTAPHEISHKEYKQKFNMSGYAAPKLNVVRVGYIGIGGRGLGSVRRMRLIEGVEIRALCDILDERVQLGQKALEEMGMPLDMDVYDAAAWSSVVPLSEWSVANFSSPVRFPDYTCGSYKTNLPVDIEMLKGGGNTGIKSISGV